MRMPQSSDPCTYKVEPDSYFQQFKAKSGVDTKLLEDKATYYRVKQNRDNTKIATDKFDVQLVCPDNSLFERAMDVASSYLSYIRADIKLDPEQNMKASAGRYWKERGFPKKRDLYDSDGGVSVPKKVFMDKINDISEIPLNTCCNKDEYLPAEEVKPLHEGGNAKLRLFEIPDADHGVRQTLFMGGQNERMCEKHAGHWIQYGASKERRGFHHMMKRLDKFTYIGEGDVSRYDKNCNMHIVYNIREKHLLINGVLYTTWLSKNPSNVPPDILHLLAMYDYTVWFTKHPHVLLPNGDIVILQTGNCSGSGSTTGDNCIFHVVIKIYECFRMLVKVFGPAAVLTKSEIDKYWDFLIYSDDFLGGCMHDQLGISPEDIQNNQIETYAEFGMKLKETAVFYTTKKEGERIDVRHSFLGSYCGWSEDFEIYIPIPRQDKIASSICYVPIDNSMGPADRWIRSFILAVHLIPVPELCNIAMEYCQFLYDHEDFLDARTVIDSFLAEEGVNCMEKKTPYSTFGHLYLGHE